MAAKYKVEYIQVNINVGDCEIILLLEEKNRNDTIKYAVLVDGGEGHPRPKRNIEEVFKIIGRKYHTIFQLDAIVITHWDKDHYEGVMKLLAQVWQVTVHQPNRKTFLKFLNGKPQTTLYVPYKWKIVGFNGTLDAIWSNGLEFGFKQDVKDMKGKKTGEKKFILCKYRADTPKRNPQRLKGQPKAWNFKEKESQLIGRNLFTDVRPTSIDLKDATNPEKLVGVHSAKMPGLYCVAVNNRFLGVGKGSAGGDKNSKNRSSIICMVINSDGIVSHYLAGDAHQELEAKVMEWTGFKPLSKSVDQVDPKGRIAIVKASHHGSYTATPITMCQTYKPKYFVFSAGNKHRHPMWEVYLYVWAYYKSFGRKISPRGDDGRYGVLMTCFPYWMKSDVRLITNKIQDKDEYSNNDDDDDADKYKETIEKFFDEKGKHADRLELVEEVYKFVKEGKDEAAKDKKSQCIPKRDKIDQEIRTLYKGILKASSPIEESELVLPPGKGTMISHVSYISLLLDRTPPVVVELIGPRFKRLGMKRSVSATPGPLGSSMPTRKRSLTSSIPSLAKTPRLNLTPNIVQPSSP